MENRKTSVVTGASRGIGRAIALKFAQNNINVAVIYAGNEDSANETIKEAKALGVNAQCYKCDVSDFESTKSTIATIIEEFNGIDILVNNAGITKDKLILQMSEDDFDSVVSINLKGAFNLTKHCYSHFMKKRRGRIINISSVSGIMGNVGQANYSAAKAGLIGLTKTTAKELAGRNITCNAIAPGFIKTDMTGGLPEKVIELAMQSIPLKRMGESEEVAELALFLASEKAAYITGEVIKIDGGLCI